MGTVTPLRRRGAARSRELLLAAAQELFAERGYGRTTLRDVGERAAVDAALVARYFGSKAGLYVAALRAELGDEVPADLLQAPRLAGLLDRLHRRGGSPVLTAAVQAPHDDPDVQEAVRAELHGRLVEPLHARFAQAGLDRPRLRAQVAVAAFAGVALAREGGALAELAAAADDDLVELVLALLGGVAADTSGPQAPGPPSAADRQE